jgi:hypothetical protein
MLFLNCLEMNQLILFKFSNDMAFRFTGAVQTSVRHHGTNSGPIRTLYFVMSPILDMLESAAAGAIVDFEKRH